jgi:hypothetical protein
MAELSALNIKITGDATDLKAAVGSATTELGKITTAADRANAGSARLATGLGNTGAAAAGSSHMLRGVAQQLSQVGQQTMATGNFVQALAIQLPDIGIGFGAIGAAAGLLAGIALPLLMSAFGGTSEKAAALAAATKELTEATAAFRLQAAAITLGVDQEEVLVIQEINRLVSDRIALEAVMAETTGRALVPLQLQHKAIQDALRLEYAKLEAYRAARGELEAIKAKTDAVTSSMGGMVKNTVAAKDAVIALVANAPSGGWLSGAISDAGALAAKLWDAAAAQASLKATGSAQVGNAPPPKVGYTGGGTGAVDLGMSFGGGGGGTNPIIGELETLQNSLMTQEQLQLESYTRQQETLRAALDQRLITQTEYAAMMEASELQHANQMAVIKTQEAQMVSDASRSMYGELEGFLNMFAGKSKAAAIASIALNKGLRIAEIIQNTAAAQMRAYAELGPVAGAVAAAKIGMMGKLQAGIVAASGLMQAGGAGRSGGGSAAGAGAGAVAQSSPTQTLNFTITNDPFGFGERVIRQIAEQLNQAQRNGVNIRAVVN